MPCPIYPNTLTACRVLGICTAKHFLIVRADEVTFPALVIAVRKTVSQVAANENIKPSGCRDWFYNMLWDMKVQVVNQNMRPVDIEMDVFEPSDALTDHHDVDAFDERLRDFCRSNVCTTPRAGRVFVTRKWHPHFATVATIIGACHPEESQWWPRKIRGKFIDPRVANDSRPPDR